MDRLAAKAAPVEPAGFSLQTDLLATHAPIARPHSFSSESTDNVLRCEQLWQRRACTSRKDPASEVLPPRRARTLPLPATLRPFLRDPLFSAMAHQCLLARV
jgi:hypothetical protein